MPKFFFHVWRQGRRFEDPEGSDLPDLAAAEAEAIASAREILAEQLKRGEIIDGSTFEITSEQGQVLATVPFRDVIRLQ